LRDLLLGRTCKDFDLASDATPEQVQELFEKTIPTGIHFGTVTIVHNENHYEITTFRKEGIYRDGRHPETVSFTRNIVQDLKRRDFTINALAFNPLTQQLVDEHGGIEDLKQRLLRMVGNPRKRLEEDGLRAWRGVRFLSQLGFAVEFETGKMIGEWMQRWDELAAVERMHTELLKTLEAPSPSYGLSFIPDLRAVDHFEPEVRLAALVAQNEKFRKLCLSREENRWVERLLKYKLNLQKASFETKDLAVGGIDIMELGPRGEEIGRVLDTLRELVIEKRSLNKRIKLIELAKRLIAGEVLTPESAAIDRAMVGIG
jgi:tRNA nucleotidyltransferase/poly(A) polymerase